MIRVIGYQKVLILLSLSVLLSFLFYYGGFILKPQIQKSQHELTKNTSEISEMTENMGKLVDGMSNFALQREEFELIQRTGFFEQQDRVEADQRLNAMQKESRLITARYSIKPATIDKNEIVKEAGYKILNTEIDLTLEALEDADIYKFLYLLNHGFPGHISIVDLKITRDKEVTQPLLRRIGVGDSTPIILAEIRVNWRTMVIDSDVKLSVEGQRN